MAMKYLFKFISFFLIFYNTLVFPQQEQYLCIWRNPERTMTKLFPKANDYKTITKKINKEKLKIIEDKVGELLPGQKEVYQYFELLDENGKLLGYISAASQKGEYGAIEFVIGFTTDKTINGIYIQRAREKDTEFKKKEFLEQFIGKSIKDIDNLEISKAINIKNTVATQSIILGIKKELVTFNELTKQE